MHVAKTTIGRLRAYTTMSKSKSKKAKAALDEPGPDDFTFLAVYFPVGRRGAQLARESSLEDQKAANDIGMWMHHIGLPIRKLFARKSVSCSYLVSYL